MRLLIENVAASYGARPVLANVTLALAGGEVLVVTGANGSGKSTLLRLLSGLQRPTHGAITYELGGQSYAPSEAGALLGWVAPDLALYRELSALENLRFFADVRGLRRSAADLDALLDRVGLDGRGHDRVASYSTGMTQRLRYAYALLHQPPVLLLDEPTATLDERGIALVERLVAEQRMRGITVVATNDPRELRWGDYLLTLGAQSAERRT
ncbi:MAG: heme ABC exporter ATP-binding protein CcmA [Chloroflexales bacterium]|nr:heme ABC exporter ATP-binding protein CcmA [Chloroflexales bacterium]